MDVHAVSPLPTTAQVAGVSLPWARRLPVGAEPHPSGGFHFRVWAPATHGLAVEIEGLPAVELAPEADGYFAGTITDTAAGGRYWLRADNREQRWPDPASRFQPEGPHGPSQLVDATSFAWTDAAWCGRPREELVLYELHVGTFTPQGNWDAAACQLPELAKLGITGIEVMPVADFPGRFGWGYDGVNLFAPTRLYGTPDDFRAFVDRAHALGIAVILDVVYNHLGPDGNYLCCFAPQYVTDRYINEWGDALNFDGPDAGPVREYFIANAGYWIDEFHLDGLRLDATQQIFDASDEHIMTALARRVREAAGNRSTFIVAENEPQDANLARSPADGGNGLDALWNDDFHHSAMVALTGHHEAYYSDYRGTAYEFVAAARYGFLYQGQRYSWQKKRRGSPAFDLPPEAFVVFLENHDQVANSATGQRSHQLTSPSRHRAITAFMLLMPGIPMLFQGQEFAASSPFFYFADHSEKLAGEVKKGRGEFLAQFPSIASPEMQHRLPDPGDEMVFRRCILNLAERETHSAAYALHRDLLTLRRDDPVLQPRAARIDGAALSENVWMLRFFSDVGDRLLVVNLGGDLTPIPQPAPLLAPPAEQAWQLVWSSESPEYGGGGIARIYHDGFLHFPGESALVLAPGPVTAEAAPELGEKNKDAATH